MTFFTTHDVDQIKKILKDHVKDERWYPVQETIIDDFLDYGHDFMTFVFLVANEQDMIKIGNYNFRPIRDTFLVAPHFDIEASSLFFYVYHRSDQWRRARDERDSAPF